VASSGPVASFNRVRYVVVVVIFFFFNFDRITLTSTFAGQ